MGGERVMRNVTSVDSALSSFFEMTLRTTRLQLFGCVWVQYLRMYLEEKKQCYLFRNPTHHPSGALLKLAWDALL